MPAALMCALCFHLKIQSGKLIVPVIVMQVLNLFSQQHIKIRLISHITSMFNTKPSRDTILILNLLMKKFPFSFTVQVEVFHYYLTTQQ